MHPKKLSVMLAEDLLRFVDAYQSKHALNTRSEVVVRALEHLRTLELEHAYAQASREVDEEWDVVAGDGL